MGNITRAKNGEVYIMANPSIKGSIFKVGCTGRTYLDRLKEANSKRRKKTWIPPSKYIRKGFAKSQYICVYSKKVRHPYLIEKVLFDMLKTCGNKRITPSREFFNTTVKEVNEFLDIIEEVGKEKLSI